MAEIFEKAWGNYVALFEFLTDPDGEEGGFSDQKGLIQTYNFASLVPYDLAAPNYNNFLLLNAGNYAAPGVPYHDTTDHLDDHTRLEHVTPLVESYSSFLDQLDELLVSSLDPSQLPEYRLREQRVSDAQQQLENYATLIHDKWADYLAAHPSIPLEERPAQRVIWERQNSYSNTLARKQRNANFANSQLNAWLRTRISSDLQTLLKARKYFDDPGYKIALPIAANHDDPRRKDYWRSFHMQFPIFDFEEFLANDTNVSSRLHTIEEHYKRVETKWRVKVKAKWGIFSGSASAERRKLEELTEREEVKFEISFKRFEEVEIFRDRWFQPILFDTLGTSYQDYWGPGGLLATFPVSLFICRGLKLSINTTDEYRRTLERFFKAGGGASFGPFFSGGGSYSKDEKYMDYRFTEEGFELADSDTTIRLLGSRVQRPNWDDGEAERYLEGFSKKALNALAVT